MKLDTLAPTPDPIEVNLEERPERPVAATLTALEKAVGQVMLGQEETVRRVLATFLAGGHVLLEDFPGTGKTTLAKAISRAITGTDFQRVQFTPDLLPSDILGVNILDPRSQTFDFHAGPIMTDILLADEINRASPRTQSALLEAMAERQVTIEGQRYPLGELFFVIATQNPVELRGTFPLPEAQMDRFALRRTLGYVSVEEEVRMLEDHELEHPLERMKSVADEREIRAARAEVRKVHLSSELREYIVRLVAATREVPEVKLAASPRASLNLMRVAQAFSLFEGRNYVLPETVQALAEDVIAHRLVMEGNVGFGGTSGGEIVRELLEKVPVPG